MIISAKTGVNKWKEKNAVEAASIIDMTGKAKIICAPALKATIWPTGRGTRTLAMNGRRGMNDLIDRQDVMDRLLDWANHSMTDAEAWHLRQVIGDIKSMPSAQPEIKTDGDTISRQAAIAKKILLEDWTGKEYEAVLVSDIENMPSVQPEPIWGLPVSADRPLADVEIVPRLRDIQKQIPGGSYAIDRAIEIIEAVAERRTDG